MNQIERILELQGGKPSASDVEALCSPFAATMLDTLPLTVASNEKSLNEQVPSATPDCRSLIHTLLLFNPSSRPTADQALSHPFVGMACTLTPVVTTFLTCVYLLQLNFIM